MAQQMPKLMPQTCEARAFRVVHVSVVIAGSHGRSLFSSEPVPRLAAPGLTPHNSQGKTAPQSRARATHERVPPSLIWYHQRWGALVLGQSAVPRGRPSCGCAPALRPFMSRPLRGTVGAVVSSTWSLSVSILFSLMSLLRVGTHHIGASGRRRRPERIAMYVIECRAAPSERLQ